MQRSRRPGRFQIESSQRRPADARRSPCCPINSYLLRVVLKNDRIVRQSELELERIVGRRFVRLRTHTDWADADQVSLTQPISGHSRLRNVL